MELVFQKTSIHTTKEFVMRALIPLNFGYITNIDIQPTAYQRPNGLVVPSYTTARIVVTYGKWYDTPNAVAARHRFQQGKHIDIVFNRNKHLYWRATGTAGTARQESDTLGVHEPDHKPCTTPTTTRTPR